MEGWVLFSKTVIKQDDTDEKSNVSRGLWVWHLVGFEARFMYLQKKWGGGFDVTLAGA